MINPEYREDEDNLFENTNDYIIYFHTLKEMKERTKRLSKSTILDTISELPKKRIQFVSIDFLIKCILTENPILEDVKPCGLSVDHTRLMLFFIQHHSQFIETSTLISKINSIYKLYSSKESK